MDNKKPIKPLRIKTNKGDDFFDYHEIIRLEADGCSTNVYNTNGEVISSPASITSFENALPENNFFRVHRSHIINLAFMTNFNSKNSLINVGGAEVPISDTYKKKFIELLDSDDNIKYVR